MRYFFSLLLVFSSAIFAKESTPLFIGTGPYFQTQPYTGAAIQVVPSPVIFFDNHLFYVRWTRVGVYVAGESKEDYSWGLSLTAQPEPFGYKANDSQTLNGMTNKDNTIEAGIALDAEYKTHFFNVVFFQDILNKSNSFLARAEVGEHLKLSKWDLYPSVMLIYHAKKFNEYYYGVTPAEATSTRAAYEPQAGIDYSFQSYAKYSFNDKWSTLLNFRVDYLNKTEQNSPIVADKYMFSGLASVMYKFELK